MRNRFSEDLLSLFTSRDNAKAIIGDLLELARARTRCWYTCEVVRLAFALCVHSVAAAPARACRFAGLGLAVFMGSYAALFVVSGLPWYPWHRVFDTGFWVRLVVVAVLAHFLTGAIVARRRSSGSPDAVAPLVALWFGVVSIKLLFELVIVSRGLVPWPRSAWGAGTVLLAELLTPFLTLLPLLLGAILSNRLGAAVDDRSRNSGQKLA